jgi:predicted Zn-dependent protease
MVNAQKDALILFSLAPGGSPEETARQFASQTHARVLRAESVHVNKLAAQRLVSDVDSSNGSMRILSYFIQKDERIYMFHGLTAQARFQQHEQVFLSTMDHFQDLTDPRRLNVKPSLLRVLAARRTAPLRQALRDLGTPESGLEEAAILNGKHLDDPVQAGSLLKIVAR